MKKFLLLMFALFTLGGVTFSAKAQETEAFNLTADMFKNWDGYGADATATGTANVDFNVGVNLEGGGGKMVCGTSTVDYLIYADLTGSLKLVFEGTEGMSLRVLMNRQESNNGPLVEKQTTIGSNGKAEVDLSEYEYVHLNAVKTNWGSSAGTITSIKFMKPVDPLGVPKAALKNKIDAARMRSAVGKTTESWNALTKALADAEDEYTNSKATEQSLNDMTSKLETAINGLTLLPGYVNLTQGMFKHYASLDAPGDGSTTVCALEMYTASDMPYGDVNVSELNWADLAAYDNLIVVCVGDVKPRFCFNRLVAGGNQASTQEASNMIDINPNTTDTWSNTRYQTIEGKKYTIDLNTMVDDYTFARLHSIKKQGWGSGVVVTDMLLYQAPVQLASDAKLEGYKTFYNANNNYVVDDNTTIYTAIDKGSYIQLNEVEGKVIPAGTPVILKTTDTSYELTVTITSATATIAAQNDLRVATGTETDKFVLAYTDADGLAFYQYENELAAGKVYVEASSAAKERLGIVVEGEATEITGVKAGAEKTPAIFNIAGQHVGDDYKGIVIKNGKKVMVK